MRAKEPALMSIYFILLGGALVIGCGAWVIKSSMEARAFNRLTGSHATTWDAMWVELRVAEAAR